MLESLYGKIAIAIELLRWDVRVKYLVNLDLTRKSVLIHNTCWKLFQGGIIIFLILMKLCRPLTLSAFIQVTIINRL